MKSAIIIIYTYLFLTFLSCGSNKKIVENNLFHQNEVVAIKYMGTITTYPHEFTEKTFWYFYDEHVVLKIRNNDFIEEVKKLPTNDGDTFHFLTYAFIHKRGNTTDTIYSDYYLKTWKIKDSGKIKYYYDSEGEIAENLRFLYSFFSDCW